MAKPKTGARKNKDIVSKEIEISPQAKSVGLPADLLKKLAGYGVVPRIEHDKVEMCDTGSLRLNWIMGGGIPRNRVTTLAGVEKSGKAQPLTAKVLTVSGFKLMGEIQVGDVLVNPDGGVANVIGTYPQGVKDIYRIEFSDGTSTECCLDHLWSVLDYRTGRNIVVSTGDLIEKSSTASRRYRYSIQNVRPVDFIEKHLPVPPYTLGAILGDGNLTNGTPVISSADQQILDRVSSETGLEIHRRGNSQYDYGITNGNQGGKKNPLWQSLIELGLQGKDSFSKFIPVTYLTASKSQRVSLLQGLMDTDGSVTSKRSTGIEYTTVSPELAKGVVDLIRSLGGRATVKGRYTSYTYKGESRTGAFSYRIHGSLPDGINPFYINRKSSIYNEPVKHIPHKHVKSICLVGKEEAKCIQVDSENQLYITDDYIVTHNTTTATIISRAEIDRGGLVAYFDTENKFNAEWAEELGVDLSRFVFMQVFTGEQLINSMVAILESKVFSGIVIDSVRGTMWDAEDQADAEAQQMGVSGKMWGKFARKTGGLIKTSGAWVLVLNGLYDSMKPGSHEQIEPGGKGVPYLASLRLRTQPLVYGEAEKEITIRVRCIHSQVGRNSKREGEYTVQYVGSKAIVNPLPDLVEMGVEYGVINQGGAWYSIADEKWQGSLAVQKAMQENPELYDHVYDSVMAKIDPNYVPPEKTHVELLGDDHEDMPLDVNEDTGEIVEHEDVDLFDTMMDDNEWVDPMGDEGV